MEIGTEQVFIVNSTELNQVPETPLQRAFAMPVAAMEPEEPETTSICSLPQASMRPPSRTHMCRLCAAVTEMVVPIFEGEGLINRLADKINQHLPIQVSQDDVLPVVLCYQCTSTVLAWHELVLCSVQADAVMRERFNLHLSATQQEQQQSNFQVSQTQNAEDKGDLVREVKLEAEESRSDPPAEEAARPRSVAVGADGKRRARCGTCGCSVSAAAWRRHARAHAGARRYSCPACGRAFADGGNLARHARTHVARRPHACGCGRTFARRDHLREHERTHAASRDFLCDVCGKASKSGAALRSHRRTHEPARHACVQCGARFKRPAELRAHASVHSGERRHACACGRAFRLRGQLTHHARSHAPAAAGAARDVRAEFASSHGAARETNGEDQQH